MRKITVIILAFLYFTASSGATMHLHYCMGKLIDWKLSENSKVQKCLNCGMEKVPHKGCCKDEHKQLKVDDQKPVEANLSLVHLISTAVITPFFELTSVYVPSILEQHPLTNAPPREQGLPLFIRNCVFRI